MVRPVPSGFFPFLSFLFPFLDISQLLVIESY